MAMAYLYSATGNRLWVVEVLNLLDEEVLLYADLAKKLCVNHKADGLMLFNPTTYELWVLNADGTNGNFCGNGVRAVAYHLQQIKGIHRVQLHMGGHDIVVSMQAQQVMMMLTNPIVTIGKKMGGYFLEVPNPHLILLNPPGAWTLEHEGAKFCREYNTNVEFVYPETEYVRVLVYERGVGPTQACGSGAIATFKVLQYLGLVQDKIRIRMSGGDLTLQQAGDKLSLSGQVQLIETSSCI